MRVLKNEGESKAVETLRSRFEKLQARRWEVARTGPRERLQKLERLKRAIVARREALAQALREDFGKPAAEVEATEVVPVLMEIEHTLSHLRQWMRPRRVGSPLMLFGTRSEVRYEPKGVVLIIAPFNYPFQLLFGPLVPAVAAGNCVMLKPSERTPHTAAFCEELVREVFDPEEVAVAQGGLEAGQALLELPFDHFFFTGGPRVGRKVMEAAARHLAGVTLELGGKSPAIVDETADVQAAAERIAWARFVNAGQTCVAPDYVLVHGSQERAFLEHIKAAVASYYGSTEPARQASPDYARLVDDAHFVRVARMLDRSLAAGAKAVVGGQVDAATRYIAPTVLTDVRPDMAVMEEEIFGPLLPVLRFDKREEALRHIRAGTKPLALYVFSQDSAVVEHWLAETTAGGTCVNTAMVHLINSNLPFGGIGESGVGNYHGEYGYRTFSHERAVLYQGPLFTLKQFFPPYGERSRKLMQWASRLYE